MIVRKRIIIIFLLLQVFENSVPLKAQAAFSYDVLMCDIESQLRKGNRRALREVAVLLDKPAYHESAIILLEKYSFFTKEEIDIRNSTRDKFLQFYSKNEDKIKYSEMLQAFYVTPVEYQTYTFDVMPSVENPEEDPSVLLRALVLEFDKSYKRGTDSTGLQKIIEKITDLDIRESYQWIRNTLNLQPFNKNATFLYLTLCEGLKNEPHVDNLNAILKVIDKNIVPPELLSSTFIELTNYSITPKQTQMLMDSLESYEALRAYGYDQVLPFKEVFFYEKVDYYAKIMSRKDTPWIQRNALRDLLMTQHPRLLFYLAAQMRCKTEKRVEFEKLLRRLTKKQFVLPSELEGTSETDFFTKLDNIEKFKNFVRFWGNHAEDFEWEESKRIFVDKAEIAQRTEVYDRLFRRLNSDNDSVARASFLQLAQGDPNAIYEMTEKFRPMLRNYNSQLPDLRYSFLEQMSRLVAFCKKNRVYYQLSDTLIVLMQQLIDTRNPQLRFNIENQIIHVVEIFDLTSIEFFACLNSANQELSFSIGRILDHIYTKYWSAITNNEEQLRLFLKKSFLFKKIGVVGICNSYQNKIDRIDVDLKNFFYEISAVESDEDIVNQIDVILGSSEEYQKGLNAKSMLDLFLEDPLSFANSDMRMLPTPQAADYQRIVGKIQSENNKEILQLMVDYLDLHPSIDAVPHLFVIIKDDRKLKGGAEDTEGVRVSDRIVALLENIYGHKLNADDKRVAWRRLWYKEQKNYQQWDKQFFDEQMLFLAQFETLTIEDILEVSKSKYFKSEHKSRVIQALKKLSDIGDIRLYKSTIPFKLSEDLTFIDSLIVAPKDLDDLIKIFEVDNDSLMWSFIGQRTEQFSIDELGSFYNGLFKVDWFLKLVINEKISPAHKEKAIQILSEYLNNSELISEFEEQLTLRHVAELQNIGLSLGQKLDASLVLDISDESKAAIQEVILMRIGYAEIGEVAPYFDKLSKKTGYNPTAFLYKDFGIPIFNPDKEAINELMENHKTLKEFDFYVFYLKKFGVDFLKSNTELDFSKIYNILKFEIVTPFTGGGFQRDYFTYGVIKLLELNFNTRLDFHEKLNENQNFYTYTATKRAVKWMQYLEDNHLVKPDPSIPSSFNRLLAEN